MAVGGPDLLVCRWSSLCSRCCLALSVSLSISAEPDPLKFEPLQPLFVMFLWFHQKKILILKSSGGRGDPGYLLSLSQGLARQYLPYFQVSLFHITKHIHGLLEMEMLAPLGVISAHLCSFKFWGIFRILFLQIFFKRSSQHMQMVLACSQSSAMEGMPCSVTKTVCDS